MRLAVLALALFGAPSIYAQTVKDYVQVEGTHTNKLTGVGIVLGLNGNGDSPKGQSAQKLINLLQHFSQAGSPGDIINAKNAALVMVTAELPPFAKKDTTIDVRVACLGDAKSLSGGDLMITDLRSILGSEDRVYAVASGRLVIQGDARNGNPTVGTVPNGATVFYEVKHEFVKPVAYRTKILDKNDNEIEVVVPQGKVFRLSLRKGDLTVASELALKINEKALVSSTTQGKRYLVAKAIDGGTIEVIIPTKAEYESIKGENTYPKPGFIEDPVTWLDKILSMEVKLSNQPTATVTINDTTKTVVWTDGVKLKRGRVALKNGTVLVIPEEMTLTELFEDPNRRFVRGAIQGQDLIDAIKALESAGLLVGRVESK